MPDASQPTEPEAGTRFLADAMLGSLARWLRILGFDTLYDPSLEDAELVERSRAEGRVLLTRDSRLVLRRRIRKHLFIRSDGVEAQLRQVLSDLGLGVRRRDLFGRCLRCNEPLIRLTPAQARSRVPPYVARTQSRFRLCPACDRVYWRATHVEGMLERLERLGLERT